MISLNEQSSAILRPGRLVGLAVFLAAAGAGAQDGTRTDTAEDTGPAFLTFRFASESALTFYGGYQIGKALAFVGVVQNPRSSYREAIVGLGATRTHGAHGSTLLGVAAAHATDGWYTQAYVLPDVRLARVHFTGTLEGYAPLTHEGRPQFYATPANLHWIVSPRFAAGATYIASAAAQSLPSHAAGLSARFAIPRGNLTLDLIRGMTRARNEIRLTFFSSFCRTCP